MDIRVPWAALAVLLIAGSACAGPSALNIIPTADVMASNKLRVAYESDARHFPFEGGQSGYLFLEAGIGDRLEAGADFYDTGRDTQLRLNAKYLLFPEQSGRPAVAAGIWHVGSGSAPGYYVAGCRSRGLARYHLGAQTCDGQTWAMAGAEYALNPKTSVMADAETGPGRYHTVGVYWEPLPATGVQVYYGRNNTASLRSSSDFVGLYFALKIPLR